MDGGNNVREYQAQVMALLNNLPFQVWFKDIYGRFIAVNEPFCRLCGREASEIIGKTAEDILPKEIAEKYRADDVAVMQSGRQTVLVKKIAGKNGDIWFECFNNPVFNEKGVIIGTAGVARDITSQKRLEAQVEQQKRFLKSLMDTIPDLLFYKDITSTYIGCNKAFAEDFLGLPEEEIMGKTDLELIGDLALAEFFRQKDTEALAAGKTLMNEETVTKANGTIIDIETAKTPFYDETGKIAGLIGISRDITARKNIERQLRESEEALRAERSLFMGGPTLIFLWRNAEGWPVEYVSPNVQQILGYAVEDFQSGKVSYLSIIHQEDREKVTAEVAKLVQEEAEYFEQTYRLVTASGEPRWFLDFTVVKRNASRQVTHYHGYMNDITERKIIEAKIAQLDRLHAVGEVAAGIGHEVRNPMTTVRGYLQLFRRKGEFAKYHEHFNTMIEELDRANAIISEFLSLAKNKSVEMKQGNINMIIQTLFPILQAEAFQKGHQLLVETSEIPDSVFDEKEIRQLILNMVRNGLDAIADSGLVTIKTYSDCRGVFLVIQDNGSGIPAEVLDKLGTPFVTTKESGTGLGLSICYQIAARHGAGIEVKTGAAGTTFTIMFAK